MTLLFYTQLTPLWDEGETALRSRERCATRAEVGECSPGRWWPLPECETESKVGPASGERGASRIRCIALG